MTGSGRAARNARARRATSKLDRSLASIMGTQIERFVQQWQTEVARIASTFGDDDKSPAVDPLRFWEQQRLNEALTGVDETVVVFAAAELETDFGIVVRREQPFVAGTAARMTARIKDWSDDWKQSVVSIVEQGHRDGLAVRDVSAQLLDAGAASQRQANAVARTTMIGTSNAASHHGASQFAREGDTKTWLASFDSRTRETHADANGQRVPFAEPFIVGGHPAVHPGDPRLPPGELVNCRCTFTWNPT